MPRRSFGSPSNTGTEDASWNTLGTTPLSSLCRMGEGDLRTPCMWGRGMLSRGATDLASMLMSVRMELSSDSSCSPRLRLEFTICRRTERLEFTMCEDREVRVHRVCMCPGTDPLTSIAPWHRPPHLNSALCFAEVIVHHC